MGGKFVRQRSVGGVMLFFLYLQRIFVNVLILGRAENYYGRSSSFREMGVVGIVVRNGLRVSVHKRMAKLIDCLIG